MCDMLAITGEQDTREGRRGSVCPRDDQRDPS